MLKQRQYIRRQKVLAWLLNIARIFKSLVLFLIIAISALGKSCLNMQVTRTFV